MSKRILAVLLTFVLFTSMQITVTAKSNTPVRVVLDGRELSFEHSAFLKNGSVFIPFPPAIEEGINAKLSKFNFNNFYLDIFWYGDQNAFQIIKGIKQLIFNYEKNTAAILEYEQNGKLIGEKVIQMDEVLVIVDDTMYLPLFIILERYGHEFQKWDESTQTVYYVTRPDGSMPEKSVPKVTESVEVASAPATSTTPSPDTGVIIPVFNEPTVSANEIKIRFNGENVVFDQPPVIDNGYTLVPIAPILQLMGATSDWYADTKTAVFNLNGTTVTLTVGSTVSLVNGKEKEVNPPPKIINDRTMCPLRFVAETFGAKVEWDGSNRIIDIFYDK